MEYTTRLTTQVKVSADNRMSIAALEGELSLSGDDDSAALPPSGVVALSEPDPEITAMLSWAAKNVGLMWNPPPHPDSWRLDEWFLGGGRAENILCHSWKSMRSLQDRGRHLLLPETNLGVPPPLTTLDSGAALVYTGIPLVKRSVAMQLCPTAATTLRDDLCLPSRACLYLSGLTGSAYRVCGEAAAWHYCRSTRPKP